MNVTSVTSNNYHIFELIILDSPCRSNVFCQFKFFFHVKSKSNKNCLPYFTLQALFKKQHYCSEKLSIWIFYHLSSTESITHNKLTMKFWIYALHRVLTARQEKKSLYDITYNCNKILTKNLLYFLINIYFQFYVLILPLRRYETVMARQFVVYTNFEPHCLL